jgi:hypothetical protein
VQSPILVKPLVGVLYGAKAAALYVILSAIRTRAFEEKAYAVSLRKTARRQMHFARGDFSVIRLLTSTLSYV